jgi:hypothetical protein
MFRWTSSRSTAIVGPILSASPCGAVYQRQCKEQQRTTSPHPQKEAKKSKVGLKKSISLKNDDGTGAK